MFSLSKELQVHTEQFVVVTNKDYCKLNHLI